MAILALKALTLYDPNTGIGVDVFIQTYIYWLLTAFCLAFDACVGLDRFLATTAPF
jgi:hypothetical protein